MARLRAFCLYDFLVDLHGIDSGPFVISRCTGLAMVLLLSSLAVCPQAVQTMTVAFLAWAVRRWWQTSPRIGTPPWRGYIAIAAMSLTGLSVLVWIVMGVWAHVIGGFPPYDPVLMSLYALGFLTAFTGFLASLAGKGNLHWPACIISSGMAMLWIRWVSAE